MFVRLYVLFVALAFTGLAAASDTSNVAQPKPLRGIRLTGPTSLRLLVANNPPVVLEVDTGRVTPISGLDVRHEPILSVQGVGTDAVVWLDRRAPAARFPAAEIYVVRHGHTAAIRIATGWEVAPDASGRTIWVKAFEDERHCTLREIGLDGRPLRSQTLPCSAKLRDAGSGAVIVRGSSVSDPRTGRILLRTGVWAVSGRRALTGVRSGHRIVLRDLRSRKSWRLAWPSQIDGMDQAAIHPSHRLVALAFADPAYRESGTQVIDVWLLDVATRRFKHLPDMPADVQLKVTSMTWTRTGRLVLLARTAGHDVVAVWRPGQKRFAVKRMRLPARNSGSDSFVVW